MNFRFPFESGLLPVVTSIFLFAVSLAFPAFYSDGHDSIAGWSAFLSGWIAALYSFLSFLQGRVEDWTCVAWFANPLLFACWIFTIMRRRHLALSFGSAALGFGLVFLATKTLPMGDHELRDVVLGSGYRLWMASIVAAIAGGAISPRGALVGTAAANHLHGGSSDQ